MLNGGNFLNIVPADVAAAVSQLEKPAVSLGMDFKYGSLPDFSLFTSVSGLKEMGDSHNRVIDDNGAQSRQAFANRFSRGCQMVCV
ncbi:Uncharacterised protein [Corynebacterium pilosum]|uniref:Uncharacterized protein n=1 Tax=Corynebacterium pilosum TaxID=35756 RepID=A0A376CP99_9CORY|nr:Uncharacterised protein [Corynebacterium pilosum]